MIQILYKILFCILMSICWIAVSAQEVSNETLYPEAGKSYAKCFFENSEFDRQETKILKFTETSWDIELDTIYAKNFEAGQIVQRIPKPNNVRWIIDRKVSSNCLSANPENCIVISLVEIPENIEPYRFPKIDSFLVIKNYIVKEPAKVELEKRAFEHIQLDGQIFKIFKNKSENITYVKFKAEKWSDWREVLCSSPVQEIKIAMIQKKLVEKGYLKANGYEHNVLDTPTKAALTQLQRDKGFPICGGMSMDMLKYLGLDN